MESAEVDLSAVRFAHKLASNEKKIRDRAIKRLRKYLLAKSNHGGLTEADMIKIWKGLHYCMWMQDKPLLQEELSEKITSLLHSFPSSDGALMFMKVFLETQAREWNGIDKFRLDKFMMMIRDMLHQVFVLLSESDWQAAQCRQFSQALALKVMMPTEAKLPDGLKLHLADIYVDELKKVSLEKMSSRKFTVLLRPFIDFIIYTPKTELASRVMSEVLYKVINTMSTVKHYPPPPPSKSQTKAKPVSTSDDEEEGDKDSGDEEMETDDVGNDEEADTAKMFIMDADFLLFLLFQLAKDTKVKAANRALVYNLVKKHPEIYDNIVNTLSSSSVDNIRAKDDGEGDGGNLEDLALFHTDGLKGDEQQQQRKRKKRRKEKDRMKKDQEEKNGNDENLLIKPSQSDFSEEVTQVAKKSKKHKKLMEKNSETPSQCLSPPRKSLHHSDGPYSPASDNSSRPGKRKKNDDASAADQNVAQKPKSAKLSLDNPDLQSDYLSLKSPETKLKKKKKSKSSKQKDSVSPSSDSAGILDQDIDAVPPSDKNSNARRARSRSQGMAASDLFSSAVEMVIYPKKNPPTPRKKGSAKKARVAAVEVGENNHLSSSNVEGPLKFVEHERSRSPSPSWSTHSSSSLAASLFSAAADRKRSSKRGRKSKESLSSSSLGCVASIDQDSKTQEGKGCGCVGAERSGSGGSLAVEEVAAAAKSVFSSIKQKYVDPLLSPVASSESKDNVRSESSMDWSLDANNEPLSSHEDADIGRFCDEKTSRSDPGPNRKKTKCLSTSESGSMTPYGKKKVVFDLRKNRANRFQDYIKSLRKQPDSPHVPERSPSTGILKPGLSPSLVDTLTEGGKKKSNRGRLKKSPKKKKKSPKGGSRSPSPSQTKLKSVRSRSDSRIS